MPDATISIREFTDPACPWAFSAEPHRQKLRWTFGDQIAWSRTMVVLAERVEDYEVKGLSPDKLAKGMAMIAGRYGMPIDPSERARMNATLPACRAVVATRLHADLEHEERLLRRLRVLTMSGALLDDPAVIARAAAEAELDPGELTAWTEAEDVEQALRADMAAARNPTPAARALDHKLADADPRDPGAGRRYTCPSYLIAGPDGRTLDLPGFQPFEAYDVALANLAPDLQRRPAPESVEEVLAWAGEPLATAEVAAIMGLDREATRVELAHVAREEPVGADGYWSARVEEALAA